MAHDKCKAISHGFYGQTFEGLKLFSNISVQILFLGGGRRGRGRGRGGRRDRRDQTKDRRDLRE